MPEAEFIGRRRELGELARWLAAAQAGAGSVVLIEGAPGMGKTSLVAEVARTAAWSSTPAVWGPSIEAEGTPPYWPWRLVLAALRRVRPGLRLPDLDTNAAGHFALCGAIADAIVEAASDHGLVVVLDDLHWADASSLSLLQVVAEQVGGSRALVAGTLRAGAPGPLKEMLPALQRERSTHLITLGGLSPEDTDLLLAQQLGRTPEPELARKVREQSDGNPFYVVQLAASWGRQSQPGRLPDTLLDIARRTLERAPKECLDVLQQLAVEGVEFDADPRQLEAIAQATALGLVLPITKVRYRFAHALLREALYASIPTAQLAEQHLRLAAATKDLNARAVHLRAALPLASVDEALRATLAAAAAAERLAPEDAAVHYREALELRESAQIHVRLARCQFRIGAVAAAFESCRRAFELADRDGDGPVMAESALVITGIGDLEIAEPLGDMAARAIRALGGSDPVVEARLRGQQIICRLQRMSMAPSNRHAHQAEAILAAARLTGDAQAIYLALQASELELGKLTYARRRLELGQEAVALAVACADASMEMFGRSWCLTAYWQLGLRKEMDTELEALSRLAARTRDPLSMWRAEMARANLLSVEGRFEESLDRAERAAAIGRRGGHAGAAFTLMLLRLKTGLLMGRGDQMMEVLSLSHLREAPAAERIWHAGLLVGLGRVEEARPFWDSAAPDPDAIPENSLWAPALIAIGRTAIAMGDHRVASGCLHQLRPCGGMHAMPGPIAGYDGPVSLALGGLCVFDGLVDEAEGHLRAAVAESAALGSPPYEAQAKMELARLLGRGAEAAALMRSAHAIATELGMQTLAAATKPGAGPLSRRELEVAALVGGGLSNPEIAERLHLSRRTAENHVKNILDKLGFDRRAQIAAWHATNAGAPTQRRN